jgi:hypothetical protein
MPEKYQVNLDSVLDCQMDEYDHGVVCDDFGSAKSYALDAFETVIDRLSYLCEQIKAAKEFDDLDLGWWEPLFVEIEGKDQLTKQELSQSTPTSSTNGEGEKGHEEENRV